MIKRFFSKGKCGLDYVLGVGKANDPRHPTIIAGDPDEVRRIIDSLTFATPFTSCALSFERVITDNEAIHAIASFEEALLPGVDTTEWDRVWVRHTEHEKDPVTKDLVKDGLVRTALHCIFANVHLPSGKPLHPYYYYYSVDKLRMDSWQELYNLTYGYASPKDANRQRVFYLGRNLPKKTAITKKIINEAVIASLANGEFATREGLCEWLEEQGVHTRLKNKSISVTHESLKKPIRLEGALYVSGGIERAISDKENDFHAGAGSRKPNLEEYRRRFDECINRKREELARKYYRDSNGGDKGYSQGDQADQIMDFGRGISHGGLPADSTLCGLENQSLSNVTNAPGSSLHLGQAERIPSPPLRNERDDRVCSDYPRCNSAELENIHNPSAERAASSNERRHDTTTGKNSDSSIKLHHENTTINTNTSHVVGAKAPRLSPAERGTPDPAAPRLGGRSGEQTRPMGKGTGEQTYQMGTRTDTELRTIGEIVEGIVGFIAKLIERLSRKRAVECELRERTDRKRELRNRDDREHELRIRTDQEREYIHERAGGGGLEMN